jgi:hypothetical protein
MTTTKIPAWLQLDTGSHEGECGVCVEECLALLLGQDKTDHPARVHKIIRDVAVAANDAEPDPAKRRLLANTLACQVDTDDVSEEVTNNMAAFVCRYSADHLPEGTDARVGAALVAAAECLENPTYGTRAEAAGAAQAAWAAWAAGAAGAAWAAEAAEAAQAAEAAEAAGAAQAAGAAGAAQAARAARAAGAAGAAEAAQAAGAAFYTDILTALIYEFDRLTGRTECHKFTAADWKRVKAVLDAEQA